MNMPTREMLPEGSEEPGVWALCIRGEGWQYFLYRTSCAAAMSVHDGRSVVWSGYLTVKEALARDRELIGL